MTSSAKRIVPLLERGVSIKSLATAGARKSLNPRRQVATVVSAGTGTSDIERAGG
jgi:hypothetical protein